MAQLTWYTLCYIGNVISAPTASVPPAIDIVFQCQHCSAPLVVDRAAAGMTLDCQQCGSPTQVPVASGASTVDPVAPPSARQLELQRLLKENDSQRIEVTSYINQLCIQLHRWKLRLQTLNERKKQLEAEAVSDVA